MKKFMNYKHKLAQFIDNLGKNTILVATEDELGGFTFEELKTESSKDEVINACNKCYGQHLIAFNGKLICKKLTIYGKRANPSEEEFVNPEEFEEFEQFPNNTCGECVGWLAISDGEPMDKVIEEYCSSCNLYNGGLNK